MWCLGVPRDVLTCKFRFMHGWDVFVGSRIISGSDFGRGGERKCWRVKAGPSIDVPGSAWGSWYAEPGSQGFRVSSHPAAQLPCLITWRAKQSAWPCGKPQYLLQPPGSLTSWKASPVCPSFSLVQALCVRGFGCESEIPARAESPAHCFWSILTAGLASLFLQRI